MKKIFIVIMLLATVVGCKKADRKAVSLVKNEIKEIKGAKFIGVIRPDSAFDNYYFSKKERMRIVYIMKSITSEVMKRTKNMKEIDPSDAGLMNLAERQMEAMYFLNKMHKQTKIKGKWIGWRVIAIYETKDPKGFIKKTEKWFTIDKEGEKVISSFEIPLP